MASLIVKIEDEDNATIDLVIGGGATGLLGADLGAEGTRSKEIEAMLKGICENKSWELVETR